MIDVNSVQIGYNSLPHYVFILSTPATKQLLKKSKSGIDRIALVFEEINKNTPRTTFEAAIKEGRIVLHPILHPIQIASPSIRRSEIGKPIQIGTITFGFIFSEDRVYEIYPNKALPTSIILKRSKEEVPLFKRYPGKKLEFQSIHKVAYNLIIQTKKDEIEEVLPKKPIKKPSKWCCFC